jgi:hypothetical protein
LLCGASIERLYRVAALPGSQAAKTCYHSLVSLDGVSNIWIL